MSAPAISNNLEIYAEFARVFGAGTSADNDRTQELIEFTVEQKLITRFGRELKESWQRISTLRTECNMQSMITNYLTCTKTHYFSSFQDDKGSLIVLPAAHDSVWQLLCSMESSWPVTKVERGVWHRHCQFLPQIC